MFFSRFRNEAERLGRALGCKLLRTSVKEDVGVMSVFRHLASRCMIEIRRCEDDFQDDLRLYSSGPRSPSVISECTLAHATNMYIVYINYNRQNLIRYST